MSAAVVGIIGSLLGVALGFGGQYLQERMHRQELLKDTKRKAYTEYLRAVDASYTQAMHHHKDRSEDESITKAVAEIELLSAQELSSEVRKHSDQVISVHTKLANDEISPKGPEVTKADKCRKELIKKFKRDLKIEDSPDRYPLVR
jgi:hypothetical protein